MNCDDRRCRLAAAPKAAGHSSRRADSRMRRVFLNHCGQNRGTLPLTNALRPSSLTVFWFIFTFEDKSIRMKVNTTYEYGYVVYVVYVRSLK